MPATSSELPVALVLDETAILINQCLSALIDHDIA
jgi:hypothetical protein